MIVVGGGASGLVCAIRGARAGLRVVLLEKTDRCGNKLALTGGKKCNFTHLEPVRKMVERFDAPVDFILPVLRRFPPQVVIRFFADMGIGARVDPDGCVWPENADARKVRERLVQAAEKAGVVIRTRAKVKEILPSWRVVLEDGGELSGSAVCVATGGASYPQTGSTADGNRLAEKLGIKTVPPFPALVSLEPALDIKEFAGITRPLVEVALDIPGVKPRLGNFLFAHRFLSGSAVLNISGFAARKLMSGERVVLTINWVPEIKPQQLEARFRAERAKTPRRQVNSLLAGFVPRRLANFLCGLAGVSVGTRLTNLGNEALRRLVAKVQATPFEIVGTEPISRATVTGGGVALTEVDPRTMMVRRFPGLYFAGEALDLWAETGGYNLHFAWASGFAVADAVARV